MRIKQLFDNEYYNGLLQNEIEKIALATGKQVVVNINIPKQKEFLTTQDVADMLGISKKCITNMISRKQFQEGDHYSKKQDRFYFSIKL